MKATKAILLAGALALGTTAYAQAQMPELYLYTYMPMVRTHVQVGDGPDIEPTPDSGPAPIATVVMTPVAPIVPRAADDVLYVNMVYKTKLGFERPVGPGHLVYLYPVDAQHTDTTNVESVAVFENVAYGTYNIYGVYNEGNPFYDHTCELTGVVINQPYWSEKLVCIPTWALRLPWNGTGE